MPSRPSSIPALGGAKTVRAFQDALITWFQSTARDYPWRQTSDPYAIFISEAMLQQTQITTVLDRGYYTRWMRAFPDWASLAAASETELLKVWEGLGYYNRARHLQRSARIILEQHGGRFPEDLKAILTLPGVGRYTAGAMLSFAFNRPAPLVDGNVARVLARVFACEEAIDSSKGQALLWEWAEALVPEKQARPYNSALMELGQRLCRPRHPDCPHCPLHSLCQAARRGETDRYPLKRPRSRPTLREEHVLLALRGGRVFLQPEEGSQRRGLWRLPEIEAAAAADLPELFQLEYAITRYRVTLRVHEAPVTWSAPHTAVPQGGWFDLADETATPPLGAPYRRALRKLREIREPEFPA